MEKLNTVKLGLDVEISTIASVGRRDIGTRGAERVRRLNTSMEAHNEDYIDPNSTIQNEL
jgi:hypothetical protein